MYQSTYHMVNTPYILLSSSLLFITHQCFLNVYVLFMLPSILKHSKDTLFSWLTFYLIDKLWPWQTGFYILVRYNGCHFIKIKCFPGFKNKQQKIQLLYIYQIATTQSQRIISCLLISSSHSERRFQRSRFIFRWCLQSLPLVRKSVLIRYLKFWLLSLKFLHIQIHSAWSTSFVIYNTIY